MIWVLPSEYVGGRARRFATVQAIFRLRRADQLAKKLGAKRVLVVTFKPAVEDAWQTDLESHVDFDGWQYLSRNSDSDPTKNQRQ